MDNNENIRTNGTRLRPRTPGSSDSGSGSKPCHSWCACCLITFSYILCLFSSVIIVLGVVNFFKTTDNLWLVISGSGFLLILIGASIYRNGVLRSADDKRKRNKRSRYKRARESHIFESHLSINMLPQCFSSLEIPSPAARIPVDLQNQERRHRPGHSIPNEINASLSMERSTQIQTIQHQVSLQNAQDLVSGSITYRDQMAEEDPPPVTQEEEEEMNQAPPSYDEVVAEPKRTLPSQHHQLRENVYRTL